MLSTRTPPTTGLEAARHRSSIVESHRSGRPHFCVMLATMGRSQAVTAQKELLRWQGILALCSSLSGRNPSSIRSGSPLDTQRLWRPQGM